MSVIATNNVKSGPALPDDANIAVLDDAIRINSAIRETAKLIESLQLKEVSKNEATKTEAKSKAAGMEHSAKAEAYANPTEVLASQIVTSGVHPALDVVAELTAKMGPEDPAKDPTVAKAAGKMGGMVAGRKVTSLEGDSKLMKQAPIFTKVDSERSLKEKIGTSGDIATTKGAKSSAVSATKTIQVAEVKSCLGRNIVNENNLGRARHLRGQLTHENAPAGPGGMGSGGQGQQPMQVAAHMQRNHDAYKDGPKGYEYPKDDTTNTDETWVG